MKTDTQRTHIYALHLSISARILRHELISGNSQKIFKLLFDCVPGKLTILMLCTVGSTKLLVNLLLTKM